MVRAQFEGEPFGGFGFGGAGGLNLAEILEQMQRGGGGAGDPFGGFGFGGGFTVREAKFCSRAEIFVLHGPLSAVWDSIEAKACVAKSGSTQHPVLTNRHARTS